VWSVDTILLEADGAPVKSISMRGRSLLDGHLGNLPTSDPRLDMIKSELIDRIASQNPHLYQRDVENIVNAIIDEIVKALVVGIE
jgi:hypothetical protein